ncbi:ATP-binding protein [Reichenbachiella carrageenanivorans]|uniref:histidine kinase n=1 Tax=Reichenbachiella carrageenanivorans TaxID=2979869 RepID=A0ABY6CXM5_9BACT|nr:ATP-binding protein [Reichenbachiella carrageenanivorans]UXX78109.1 ATP-binding protein [Reichenbachiella carrageenanivorans]
MGERHVDVRFFLILFLSIVGIEVVAQPLDAKLTSTQNLSISDGLAHNGVTDIYEDSRGFVWVATYDGLNRYDGYEFRKYKNTLDEDYLISNRVRALNEDKRGKLWIGTDDGITLYDFRKDKFEHLFSNENPDGSKTRTVIRKIWIGQENDPIICTTEGNGILLFNTDYKLTDHVLPQAELGKDLLILDVIKVNGEQYVLATSKGLIRFDLSKNEFTRVAKGVQYASSFWPLDDTSFVVTTPDGLVFVDHKSTEDSFDVLAITRRLEGYNFNSVQIDQNGNLWASMLHNSMLKVTDARSLKAGEKYSVAIAQEKEGLRASTVFISPKNGCWLGTFNLGIYRFNLQPNPFISYVVDKNNPYGIRTNFISSVLPYDDKRVFISAVRGGIGLFNTESFEFEPLPFDFPKRTNQFIGHLLMDSHQDIWMKISNLGVVVVRHGQRKLEVIDVGDFKELKNGASRGFVEDSLGNIWIGGQDDLYRLSLDKDRKVKNIESINAHPALEKNKISIIRTVYADPLLDCIWVGTSEDGLYRIWLAGDKPLEDHVIERYKHDNKDTHSLSSDFVTSILRLPNNDLWIGTERGGICKVINSETNPTFVSYSEKHGLSNNVVKSILYDEEYNLWISTNIGLNKFDTKSNTFRVFRKEDGLPFEDFNYPSASMNNGIMVISSQRGFITFNPKDIPIVEELPQLEFGDFRLYNQRILPGDTVNNYVLIDETLAYKPEIVLQYNENVFSIEVLSLHFSNPSNHYLKYKLAPINEEWIEVPSSQNHIAYNGLQPGKYELDVMASNTSNNWTVPKKLQIVITPPIWKTPIAYVLYFVLFALACYIVIYVITRIQSLNHKLHIDQLEIDKVKEVNEAKLRFFSNISHEIKTPLTLISGPVNMLFEQFRDNEKVNGKLEIVRRQSKKILQLVDQVHDFQRADVNLLKMNYTLFSFNQFVESLMADFEFMASSENKKLSVQCGEDEIFVWADQDKLGKVLDNLLSNAFKYTVKNDTIVISYFRKGEHLILSVKDSGKGIDTEDLPHIFERFYQSHAKNKIYSGGSGIGLAFSKRLIDMHYGYISAESELGQGTTITVRLPVISEQTSEVQHQLEREVLQIEESYQRKGLAFEEVDLSGVELDKECADAVIFFAEDNTDMRAFVSSILENFFQLKTFTNGQECLDALETEWPDLVISDVLMPELNGFELCKSIKEDIKTSHIPVILLTACSTLEDQIKGINKGADAYINKPFDVQYLVSTVTGLLKSRKQLHERFQVDLPLRLERTQTTGKDHAFLEKLYSLLAENLDNEELDINSFAKELYLNRTLFYQKVKALTNQTPFELLKMYRLKKAAEFLLQKNYSVNEVHAKTGFKSRTHFAKLFKAKYGVSPGKYATETLNKYSGTSEKNN